MEIEQLTLDRLGSAESAQSAPPPGEDPGVSDLSDREQLQRELREIRARVAHLEATYGGGPDANPTAGASEPRLGDTSATAAPLEPERPDDALTDGPLEEWGDLGLCDNFPQPVSEEDQGEHQADEYDSDEYDTEEDDTEEDDTEEDDSEDPASWADVEELADAWSHVWVNGSESAWYRYAWRALDRAGLADSEGDDLEHCKIVVRLAALVCLYEAFQTRAYDGMGHPADWIDNSIDLAGPYPRCSPFHLGRLCERLGVDLVEEEVIPEMAWAAPPDLPRGTTAALIRAVAPEVAAALISELGDNFVFASMYASRGEVRFPLSGRRYDAAVNEDVTGEKLQAWEWLSNGMDLDDY